MDRIENVLNHMSLAFNREIILPKEAEIAEDETFKWRALKNNQFAKRLKKTQTKRTKNMKLAPDNSVNKVIVEIEKDINGSEIQVLTQKTSYEKKQHDNSKNVNRDGSCHKNMKQLKSEIKSTSKLVKQMSSTFNTIRKIKTYLPVSNAKDSCQLKTRRSNRLEKKNNFTINSKRDICNRTQNNIDLNFSLDNREMLRKYSAFKTKNNVVNKSFISNRDDVSIRNIKCKSNEPDNKMFQICKKQRNTSTEEISNNTEVSSKANLSQMKTMKIKNLVTCTKIKKNQNNHQDQLFHANDKLSIEQKEENIQNVFSESESVFRVRQISYRSTKHSPKILPNMKIIHGFELQKNARLRLSAEICKKQRILLGSSLNSLQSNSSKTKSNKIRHFLLEIKRLHLINNKSPENKECLSKPHLLSLQKLKESHLLQLGLIKTCNNSQDLWKLKRKQSKSYETMTNDCNCENHDSYSTISQCRMECTAIDDVNGQLIKCGNKLQGSIQNILRPGLKSSYQILCAWHSRRFRLHSCCPQCGIYCTQGEFAVCSQRHIFHVKCAKGYAVTIDHSLMENRILKCLHCGVEEKSSYLKTIIQT